MVSAFSLITLATTVLAAPRGRLSKRDYDVKSCDLSGLSYTCETSSSSSDSCCSEKDGVLLQTQFWDYDTSQLPSTKKREDAPVKKIKREWLGALTKRAGKSSSQPVDQAFTIHGLWNDKCDGSYESSCNADIELSSSDDLESIFSQFGQSDLYNLMLKYWTNDLEGGTTSSSITLWEHEWNKHGTCMNTINPDCFNDYQENEAPVEFYSKVVDIWDGLNTYAFLESAGITPSTEEKYSLSDVQSALNSAHGGKEVYVGCKNGAINQIYYYYHLKGSVLTGQYKEVDSITDSNCPSSVWYIPK